MATLRAVKGGDQLNKDAGGDGDGVDLVTAMERQSLDTLAVLSADPSGALAGRLRVRFPEFQVVTVEEAVDNLLTLTISGDRQTPRVVVLDRLVRLAVTRRGKDLRAMGETLDELVTLLGHEDPAGPTGVRPDVGIIDKPLVDAVRQGFDELANADANLLDAWPVFVKTTQAYVAYSSTEVYKPVCNDALDENARAKVPVYCVEVVFHTDKSVSAMEKFVKPQNWKKYSSCFKQMKPLGPEKKVQNPAGWDRDFHEKVVPFAGCNLEADLHFEFRKIKTGNKITELYCSFQLLHVPAAEQLIQVDYGFMRVETDRGEPEGRQTKLTATKAIGFNDPTMQSWPTVACDTFWLELVTRVAVAVGSEVDP